MSSQHLTTDELRDELRARTAEHAADGNVSLLMTIDEAEELWYGRVPQRVREMARCASDWYFDDLLAANAAKPVTATKRRAKGRQKSGGAK